MVFVFDRFENHSHKQHQMLWYASAWAWEIFFLFVFFFLATSFSLSVHLFVCLSLNRSACVRIKRYSHLNRDIYDFSSYWMNRFVKWIAFFWLWMNIFFNNYIKIRKRKCRIFFRLANVPIGIATWNVYCPIWVLRPTSHKSIAKHSKCVKINHSFLTCVLLVDCCHFEITHKKNKRKTAFYYNFIVKSAQYLLSSSNRFEINSKWDAQIVHANVRPKWTVLRRSEIQKKNFWG